MNKSPSRGGIGVAVFVKTPGISPLKTRLAQTVGRDLAEEFHVRSSKVMEKLLLSWQNEHQEIQPYWAVAEEEGMAHPLWANLSRVGQGIGSLGERLSFVFDELWARHEQVIFLGNDSPQLTLGYLNEAIEKKMTIPTADFYFGLTEDGGFYLLLAKKNIPRPLWTGVEYSQNNTAEKLAEQLSTLGNVVCGQAIYDVDQGEDLFRLSQEDHTTPQWLPEQRALLEWAKKIVPDSFSGRLPR